MAAPNADAKKPVCSRCIRFPKECKVILYFRDVRIHIGSLSAAEQGFVWVNLIPDLHHRVVPLLLP
ncbi:hypothetical protein BDW75DRAFT_226533 [Aspergillus navahoensis]